MANKCCMVFFSLLHVAQCTSAILACLVCSSWVGQNFSGGVIIPMFKFGVQASLWDGEYS